MTTRPPLSDYEKRQLNKILEACKDFTEGKVYELNSLTAPLESMSEPRKLMLSAYERYRSLKRATEKNRAWERVADQVFRIEVIAGSNLSCNIAG